MSEGQFQDDAGARFVSTYVPTPTLGHEPIEMVRKRRDPDGFFRAGAVGEFFWRERNGHMELVVAIPAQAINSTFMHARYILGVNGNALVGSMDRPTLVSLYSGPNQGAWFNHRGVWQGKIENGFLIERPLEDVLADLRSKGLILEHGEDAAPLDEEDEELPEAEAQAKPPTD